MLGSKRMPPGDGHRECPTVPAGQHSILHTATHLFGVLDSADFGEFIGLFLSGHPAADQADRILTIHLADLAVVEAFIAGLP